MPHGFVCFQFFRCVRFCFFEASDGCVFDFFEEIPHFCCLCEDFFMPGCVFSPSLSVETVDRVTKALKEIYDPEIPVNIFDLGLIYEVRVKEESQSDLDLFVVMSLTSPACPVAGEMPEWVFEAVMSVEGVSGCEVKVTFDPPWGIERMTEEAQLELGLM